MERNLTLITIIAVLVSLSLIIALSTVLFVQKNRNPEGIPKPAEALSGDSTWKPNTVVDKGKGYDGDLCLTPECIHAASQVLANMDSKVEPCDDFYEFACGNFEKNTNIPDDKSSVSEFSNVDDKLQEQLRTMIEEPIQQNESKPFVLAKVLYKSCMNKSEIERRGVEPILNILQELGGWPVLDGDKWNEKDFTWVQSVYKFRKVGYSVDYFLDFSIGIDLKNSTIRKIDVRFLKRGCHAVLI